MNKHLIFILLAALALTYPHYATADEATPLTPIEEAHASTTTANVSVPLLESDAVDSIDAATEPDVASSTQSTTTQAVPNLPAASSVKISLIIATRDTILFESPVTVAPCAPQPGNAPVASGYCALEQSGVPAKWMWYGSDAFIDSIGGMGNDYAGNTYWNWFSDLSYGMTSLDAHILREGESLIVSIDRFPLRIMPIANSSEVGSPITLTVEQFGFDSAYNPVWEPAASSTVLVSGTLYETLADGTVTLTPSSVGTVTVSASKDGYLDAAVESVDIGSAPSGGTGTGGDGNDPLPTSDPVDLALSFLMHHQRPDGSFENPLVSDWAALALRSKNASTGPLKTYLRSASGPLTSATDLERRVMALAALGIDPRSEVTAVLAHFDGVQIGEPGLWNDDIFGLIALRAGGYDASDTVVQSVVASLIKAQNGNGSWGSTDLTAAAIQALRPLSSLSGVEPALTQARGYLVSMQQQDGCFGNSFSTSWSIMAITALGESSDAWRTPDGATPDSCLRALQSPDGGFEEGAGDDTRAWATAYALPALSGEVWDSLMRRFPKPAVAKAVTADEPLATATVETSMEVLPPTASLPADESPALADMASVPTIVRASVVEPAPASLKLAAAAIGPSLQDTESQPQEERSGKGFWATVLGFLEWLFSPFF